VGTRLRDYDTAAAVALVELATDGRSEPVTVMLSVSSAGDVAALHEGGYVGPETAKRLACDARLQIGERTARTTPGRTRGAAEVRDHGRCTFPGCDRTSYLQCHHVVPFSHGGPTTIDNLQLVCWTHHQLVHEGGWSIRGPAGPAAQWHRPDGTAFEPRADID